MTRLDWDDYAAALFDLDGVVTPTAEVHMRAWSQMFNDFLTARGVAEPYTDEDYFAHVDGKPRYEGVAAFLASRGIDLPQGDPSDNPDQDTVCGLGNRKNDAFNEVLARDGVEAYPGSVRLLEALAERNLPMAIVSSSKNAPAVLEAAGVDHFFGFVMHGGVAAERGIAGKPAPDTFLAAAEELGVEPAQAVVLEDALSGVEAGAAGHFGLVIGVDRGAGEQALTGAGATLVVEDLGELL
ncbi:HAD family hydrolase [Knoellia subterranea]|uniref:Beta-phosphoglucomutase n=1 Tax=Knoellia subterranea KCTC 19937 TaxID=1385521 RepID=A0A0A0JJS4_9MICO|nr:beta-phosphoglucomutase family hydrolase [Knoellia subterranea]KGN37655.1 haloacid dehalogenase [Knoellia subterranea KCTC 19937]